MLGSASICFAVDQAEAKAAVDEAQARVATCYKIAASAAKNGANITDLLAVLNSAGDLLSRADLAFSQSDYSVAHDLAGQCVQSLTGFEDTATGTNKAASQRALADLLMNIATPIAGAFTVVVVGVAVWLLLKRKYSQQS